LGPQPLVQGFWELGQTYWVLDSWDLLLLGQGFCQKFLLSQDFWGVGQTYWIS